MESKFIRKGLPPPIRLSKKLDTSIPRQLNSTLYFIKGKYNICRITPHQLSCVVDQLKKLSTLASLANKYNVIESDLRNLIIFLEKRNNIFADGDLCGIERRIIEFYSAIGIQDHVEIANLMEIKNILLVKKYLKLVLRKGAAKNYDKWDLLDVKYMKEMALMDLPLPEMAARLRRSQAAIKAKARQENLALN